VRHEIGPPTFHLLPPPMMYNKKMSFNCRKSLGRILIKVFVNPLCGACVTNFLSLSIFYSYEFVLFLNNSHYNYY